MIETNFMRLAIQLAESVKGQTSPNPPVGAVVVKNNMIVGMGAHMQYGQAHAEVIALQMAGTRAKGATLFVTLEPCCHYGKTPPCVNTIIEHEVGKVVVACKDNNEKVSGKGIGILRKAGIQVEVGLLKEEALPLYDIFFQQIKTKLPFVTVKVATSLDGKIATTSKESKWITNNVSRQDAHQYRHQHDAILVGIQTVLEDNPKLTTRLSYGRNPVRIILDSKLRTPLDAHVVTDEQAATWIFVGSEVEKEKIALFSERNFVRIFQMKQKRPDVKEVLSVLMNMQISSVLVEGGATVNSAFLEEKLINQLICYIAPIIIGGQNAPSAFEGNGFLNLTETLQLTIKKIELLDGDIKMIARTGE